MTVDEQARPRTIRRCARLIAQRARAAAEAADAGRRSMRSRTPTRSPSARPPASRPAPSVQPSTLVRFSQALGYQGFTELQDVFRSRLRERVLNYDERLAQMREHGIADQQVRPGARRLPGGRASARSPKFRDKVDHEAIERAVDILAGAETIYLIGLRRSFPITSYMGYAMGKLGIRNILVDAVAGMGAEQASFITRARRRACDQLHALCQRDGGADQRRQGARREDRLDHRFGVLADRLAGRCADRDRRGEFRGLSLDGGDAWRWP